MEGIRSKSGSVEKRLQSYQLWTTDHPPSRHVPSSWALKALMFTADDRGSGDEHSNILILTQNVVTSKILKTHAKLTL